MSLLIDSLNPAQKEAALCTDRHVRIVAGAGSGKTRVLMARIEYLILKERVRPSRILAITFTNKAANEMKVRLKAQLGEDADKVRISTIHSLCLRILREDASLLGYPRDFVILDSSDQTAMLKKIYKKLNLSLKEYPTGGALGMISLWNRKGAHPSKVLGEAQGEANQTYARIYQEYYDEKNRMRAMDFDDLLILAERLLRLHDEPREKWQSRLDYLHVDEFQDIDPIQYQIIRHLTGEDAILAVVGDPDQTIYTWRGASIDIIMNFEKDFSPSSTIFLTENYRSSKSILQASNAVISYNRNRLEKELTSSKEGGPVSIFEAPDEESEAKITVSMMENLETDGIDWKEMAILYRSNYMSRIYEKELRMAAIPYRVYGSIRFYERAEIKDILSYLHLLQKPSEDDPNQFSLDLALERVVNVPKRGIGPKFMEQLDGMALAANINLLSAMRDPNIMSAANQKKALAFVQIIDQLKEDLEKDGLENIIGNILDRTGYRKMLMDDKEEGRLENVLELENDIRQELKEDPSMTLETYLQNVALFSDVSEEEADNSVTLMTVHAAKGTEFDTVFIGGLNEGIFPNQRAMNESGLAGLEEERRLMYVAMTRAKQHLYISSNKGYSYQSGTHKTPSRFIREIPVEFTNAKQRLEASRKKPEAPKRPKTRRGALSTDLRAGSRVKHKSFGEGTVIQADGAVITVLFDKPLAQKKIARNYLELIS